MDFISNLGSLGNAKFDPSTIFASTDLRPRVQQHLVKVYSALAATLLAASVGVVAHLNYNLAGTLSGIGSLLALFQIQFMREERMRVGMMLLFGFLQGCNTGPLIQLALDIDPSVVLTAFIATTCVFACFSASAIFSARRSYLYLGGILSSTLSLLSLAALFQYFTGSSLLFNASIYIGLAMFCGYVLYDTQLIIEKADKGNLDYPTHAAELFIDFAAIFVRLLVILLQNRERKEKEEKNRSRNR